MKDLLKLLACACCAGIVLLTGCNAINEQAEASNTAANTANTNIATVQPASSNTLENTSTPVKPTAAYTSREPQYTFNPATPAPTRPLPVIAGAEFVRPSDEEIAELKEAYEAEFQELDYDERMYLNNAGAVVSYENACVGYDFRNYVLRDYDWEKGMPSVEDVLNNGEVIFTNYTVPIYSRYYNLIGRMYQSLRRSKKSSFISHLAKDSCWDGTKFIYPKNDYWEEAAYDAVLPLHMKAHYAYEAVQEARLGNIQNMILFTEDTNYAYCLIETNKGSYVYTFPYENGEGIRIHDKAQRGILYTDAEEFRQLYTERMNNPHFVEGGLVVEPIEPEK